MTGMIVLSDEINDEEQFLVLYLRIAYLLNRQSAISFGLIKLAKVYLKLGKYDSCHEVIGKLKNMNLNKNKDVIEIEKALKQKFHINKFKRRYKFES